MKAPATMTWERLALLLNQLFYFKEYASARNEIRDAAFLETSHSPERNAMQLLALMQALYETRAQVPEPKPEPPKPAPPPPAEEEEDEEQYDDPEYDDNDEEDEPEPLRTMTLDELVEVEARVGHAQASILAEECYCRPQTWPTFSYEMKDYLSRTDSANTVLLTLIHAWQHGCNDSAMPRGSQPLILNDPVKIRAFLRGQLNQPWTHLYNRRAKSFNRVMKLITCYYWWARGQNNRMKQLEVMARRLPLAPPLRNE